MADYLIKNGANINEENQNGWSIFHLAIIDRNDEMVKLLLEYGAEVDKKGHSGRTALHLTDTESLAKILVQNGASLKIKDWNGDTPFESALSINREDVLKVLMLHS